MKKTIIIAEAGVNHNGKLEIAKKLIDVAASAGADYIKFQTFKTENLVTKTASKAVYQINNSKSSESQYEMLKKLELDDEKHKELIQYCNKKSIKFLSTAFDTDSLNYLISKKISLIKIPSGEITNYPYLKYAAQFNKKIILSTGMSTIYDIKDALSILKKNGTEMKNITLLHCTTEYPAPFEEVNLRAITSLKKRFGLDVGYSDHTSGIEISIAAVAIGACIIEKHFTLNRNMIGPDHKASITPKELQNMIAGIRKVEKSLGDGVKKVTKSEKKNIPIARKSIVAKVDIKKGEKFTEKNLCTKRPGNGISPMRFNEVIGKIAYKNFNQDELISLKK
jgi:N,N'-diacetyllegionaminate synthase